MWWLMINAMASRKCCVGSCNATSKTHRLFSIPKNDKLRDLWLSFLIPTNVELSGLSKDQLVTKYVCQNHFDRLQFDSKGDRLHHGYPCLFTANEILHGIPLTTLVGGDHLSDHNYELQITPDDSFDSTVIEGDGSYASSYLPIGENIAIHFKILPGYKLTESNIYFGISTCVPDHHCDHIYCIDWRLEIPISKYTGKQSGEPGKERLNTLRSENILGLWLNSIIQNEISNTEDAEDKAQSDVPTESMVTDWQDEQDVEKNFSWQEQPEAAVDLAAGEPDIEYMQDDLSLYCSDDEDRGILRGTASGTVGHVGFHCNFCTKDIVGYRYVCVQCSDFDLCSSCEANGEHDHHYVLRIPGPRPYREVQTILASIRKHLMIASDPIKNACDDCISVKSEMKEENEDVEENIEWLESDARQDMIQDESQDRGQDIMAQSHEDKIQDGGQNDSNKMAQSDGDESQDTGQEDSNEIAQSDGDESQYWVQYESQDRGQDDSNEIAQSDGDESQYWVQYESQDRGQDDSNEIAQSDEDSKSEEDPLAMNDAMDTESAADSDDVWVPSKEDLRLAAIEGSSDEPKTKIIPIKHKAHCKPVQMQENARIDMNQSNSESENVFIYITDVQSRKKKRILMSKSDFEKYLKIQPIEKKKILFGSGAAVQ